MRGEGRLRMLEKGTVLQGHRVDEFLGQGGSGAVYRAVHLELERDVALKVVAVGGGRGSDERKRFHREARALARLTHAGIVRIYDFGEEEGFLFYSMELAPGMSLDRELSRRGPFGIAEVESAHGRPLALFLARAMARD